MSTENTAGAAAETTTSTTDTGATTAPEVVQGGAGGETTGATTETTQAAKPDAGAPLAGGGSAADPEKPVTATWPEDWRQKMAGDDAAYLKQLERFDSPAAVAKSLREAQLKISQGAAKPALPKDATPEQLAAFRKEAGIPETADAYDVKPSNGYVFGEADKPALDSFKAFAHANHWTPEQVQQGGEWYAQQQEQIANLQAEQDSTFKAEAEDSLRKEWGGEYRRNLTTVQNFLASHAPDGLADRLLGGRSADGRRLGDDPAMLAFLVRAARDANPMASVLPAGEANPGKAVADELSGLKKMMGDQRSEYWRGPDAQKNQARYRELKNAERQQSARG